MVPCPVLSTLLALTLACRTLPVDTATSGPVDTGPPALDTADYLVFDGARSWDFFRGSSERFELTKAGETRLADGGRLHWLDVWQSRAFAWGASWSTHPDLGVRLHGHQLGPETTDSGFGEPAVTYLSEVQVVGPSARVGDVIEGTDGVAEVIAEEPCDSTLINARCLVVHLEDDQGRPWAGTWWFAKGVGPVRWLPPDDAEPWEILSLEAEERDYPQGGAVDGPGEVHWELVQSGVPTDLPWEVTNTGAEDLELQDATLTFNGGDLFSVRDFDGRVLAPGETGELTLRVSIPNGSLAVATADLRVLTSALDAPDVRVGLFLDSSQDTVVVGVR